MNPLAAAIILAVQTAGAYQNNKKEKEYNLLQAEAQELQRKADLEKEDREHKRKLELERLKGKYSLQKNKSNSTGNSKETYDNNSARLRKAVADELLKFNKDPLSYPQYNQYIDPDTGDNSKLLQQLPYIMLSKDTLVDPRYSNSAQSFMTSDLTDQELFEVTKILNEFDPTIFEIAELEEETPTTQQTTKDINAMNGLQQALEKKRREDIKTKTNQINNGFNL